MAGYNPISYHIGSVWPHDNAIIAAGLMRYGFVEEAHRVISGLLDAAAHFGDRLPELFGGLGREEVPFPVSYPSSCSPAGVGGGVAAAVPADACCASTRGCPTARCGWTRSCRSGSGACASSASPWPGGGSPSTSTATGRRRGPRRRHRTGQVAAGAPDRLGRC